MNPAAFLGRVRRNATPHTILSVVIIAFLLYVVVVPLAVMIKETFIVHPMERFQIPGAMPGDATLHHWKKTFTGSSAGGHFLQAVHEYVDNVDQHVDTCHADRGESWRGSL